ncbi:MAG: nitroreductase family protein [Alteromonadaceae bacterium]|nr:nitroreductase family protein [Alteromonadaceae bacterium]
MSDKHLPLTDFVEYDPEQMLSRATDFNTNLRRRHSIRRFSDRDVDKAIIEQCILAAGSAPSGANHQPWHFVAISEQDMKEQIRATVEHHEHAFYSRKAGEEWLEALKPLGTNEQKPYLSIAPWLIAVFSQKTGGIIETDSRNNYYVHESVGIATGMLITALHHAGLATLTHTPKPMQFLVDICKRPDNERAFMLIIAGYPAEDATVPEHATVKKPLTQIATFVE